MGPQTGLPAIPVGEPEGARRRYVATHTTVRGVRRQPTRQRGFTLLEALLALIMFGLIMAALAMVFSTALRVHSDSEKVQDDNGTVRAVLDSLKRDILAANASVNDPSSVFIAGGSATSNGGQNDVSSPGLLTLSTFTNRIQADDLFSAGGSNTSNTTSSSPNGDPPQSSAQLVRYDLDQNSGQFTRTVITVPNPTLVAPPNGGDNSAVLANNIKSVTFHYWDSQQQMWRDTWDYEQQNQSQAPQQQSTTGTASTSTTTPNSAGSNSSQASNNTDTYLPSAVQVAIVYTNSRGVDQNITTVIPVFSSQPFIDPNSQPTTGSSSTPSGAAAGGASGGTGGKTGTGATAGGAMGGKP